MELKTIVLITTGQPSVNPRIVKEADALHAAGYKVTVLYCFWTDWAINADTELLRSVKWSYQLIGGNPYSKRWKYIYTKLRLKANRLLNKVFGNNFFFAERSIARCYNELLKAAKSIRADLYIGHNLGALAIAVQAAKYNMAKSGFDFEDYHRGEHKGISYKEYKKIVYLEERYVPQLYFFSTSSPLIEALITKNFPLFTGKIITLLNCFPLSQQPIFKKKPTEDNTLQLLWFSQTIGTKRGLEVLIEALRKINDPAIHLSLAGICKEDFCSNLKSLAGDFQRNIHFTGIVPPGSLPSFCASFDIGLALETGFSTNNSVALSNKLFTYLLAGNAVIVSTTEMQKKFNDKYKIGEAFETNNCENLIQKILLYKNKNLLEKQRIHNYKLANKILNWENESKKLLSIIN